MTMTHLKITGELAAVNHYGSISLIMLIVVKDYNTFLNMYMVALLEALGLEPYPEAGSLAINVAVAVAF